MLFQILSFVFLIYTNFGCTFAKSDIDMDFLKNAYIDSDTQETLANLLITNLLSRSDIHNSLDRIIDFPTDEVALNVTADFTNSSLSSIINGVADLCDVQIAGLSSFIDNLGIVNGATYIYIIYTIDIGSISFASSNAAELMISNILHLTSYGDFLFELDDAHVNLTLRLEFESAIAMINVTEATLDVRVGRVNIIGDDTLWNGNSNWGDLFEAISILWGYAEQIVDGFAHSITKTLLQDCSILDLITSNFTCTGLGDAEPLPIEFVDKLTCGTRPTEPPTPTDGTTEPNNGSFRVGLHFDLFTIISIYLIAIIFWS